MKTSSIRSRWAAIGAAVAVSLGGGGVWIASAAETAPTALVSIDPTRVLDTREAASSIHTLGPDTNATLSLASSVPADAVAVSLNVTAIGGTAPSYLLVYPTGTAKPTASNVNWTDADVHANAATVKLGTNSSVDIYNANGSIDVIIDLTGWYIRRHRREQRARPARTHGPQGTGAKARQARLVPSVRQDRWRVPITGV